MVLQATKQLGALSFCVFGLVGWMEIMTQCVTCVHLKLHLSNC